jgi:hypothetical protein
MSHLTACSTEIGQGKSYLHFRAAGWAGMYMYILHRWEDMSNHVETGLMGAKIIGSSTA